MYHGKVIYNPSGKAGEYAKWAANFYNGCSAKCEYCYNRKGITAKVLGSDVPTLKKCLVNEEKAKEIFKIELWANLEELQKYGLFFNFVSDPCLKETFELNFYAIRYCTQMAVPVKLLTKQTWWIDWFLGDYLNAWNPKFVSIGFTVTGFDSLEPGAATNMQRVYGAERLHNSGFKIFGSFEPVIDCYVTYQMILHTKDCFDLFKIGLQSGKKYDKKELLKFMKEVQKTIPDKHIYWKDSLLKAVGINRSELPSNCVTRDFNL